MQLECFFDLYTVLIAWLETEKLSKINRIELLNLIDLFLEGSIDDSQFSDALSNFDLNDQSGLQDIIDTFQYEILDNPYKPWKWYYQGEAFDEIQRVRKFLQTDYPVQNSVSPQPCYFIGFLCDLIISTLTLRRMRYKPYVEWESKCQEQESYWPFPSLESYEKTMHE